MSHVVIIGSGPAGISAALYTIRAGIPTTVIGNGKGALIKAEKIENYYGFTEPLSGKALIQSGIEQAKRLGVQVIEDEVTGLGLEENFAIKTANAEFHADSVIVATGTARKVPDIKGFHEYEGRGVSYCAVCDAFFYRNKDVAVMGCCDYAISEALELFDIAKSVTIITNGERPSSKIPETIKVIVNEVAEFVGGETLEKVVFQDGSSLPVAGVFVALGVAGSTDLARKVGAETNGNRIVINEHTETNIPGLFAAGDCTGGMLQISKAVYEGALAGTEAIKYIRKVSAKK